MRICLVAHGFPPNELTGVENYTAALARALARAGHRVEVFAPRRREDLPALSLRRELRHGYAITWLTEAAGPRNPQEMLDPPGIAERFASFLDAERPEIVHFQHVIKLGLGLVEAARERRIPTLLTAHDYYGVCHRFTLMRPDLQRCDVIGDPQACTRCDLALSLLNSCEELGDYHMGAFEDQVDEPTWSAVQATLDGDPSAAGFPAEELSAAEKRRGQLDERRQRVFASFDRVLAPTRFLGAALARGGVPEKRIHHLPYGIETAPLAGVAPVDVEGRKLRFGFLGGMSKHKGVHVLLAAFGELDGAAELLVWGGSSDRVYVERMRAEAQRVGAEWRGSYLQPQLAECLAEVDVVVVPSIWVENYPIVIREAFAAGRPVIAGDFGALPESVADGRDGLRFPAGDAAGLAEAMRRFVEEPDLLGKLVAGIDKVKSIEEQVSELEAHYVELAAQAARGEAAGSGATDDLPSSLTEAFAGYTALEALPTRDLFKRCLDGLGGLQERLLGEQATTAELLAEGLDSDSEAQTLLRDLRRQARYQREAIERERAAGEERDAWQAGQLDAEKERARWLAEQKAGVDSEALWLRETLKTALEKATWLDSERQSAAERADWLEADRKAKEQVIDQLQAEIARKEEALADRDEALAARDAEIVQLSSDAELAAAAFASERGAFANLLRHTLALGLTAHGAVDSESRTLQQLMEVVAADSENGGNRRSYLDKAVPAVREASGILETLLEELQWRREEMDAALEAFDRRAVRALVRRTGLGKRLMEWDPGVDEEAQA